MHLIIYRTPRISIECITYTHLHIIHALTFVSFISSYILNNIVLHYNEMKRIAMYINMQM